jgi:small subunit ribosomal protein S11
MFIAKRIQEMCRDYKIKTLYIRMKGETGETGIGPGANTIVKTLTKEGFKILSIADTTCVARGGPKKKGGRRGRRV